MSSSLFILYQDVEFVRQNKIAWEDLKDGPVVISIPEGSNPVVDQLWSTFQEITTNASHKMEAFLSAIGVLSTTSPFCCHFKSAIDLHDEFIKHSPRLFKYDTKSGEGKVSYPEETPINEESESFEVTMEDCLHKIFKRASTTCCQQPATPNMKSTILHLFHLLHMHTLKQQHKNTHCLMN